MLHALPTSDLDSIFTSASPHWNALKNQRIFITGGTGFFGCWLLSSFIYASEKLGLNAQATVLTRDAAAFRKKAPHLSEHPAIHLHEGDIKDFQFPKGRHEHIIHAAADPAESNPTEMLDTIIKGTERTLEFATHCGARRYLLVSSGAVYGKQPPELDAISEIYTGDPDSAYGIGKRAAEKLCRRYKKKCGVKSCIARCFAFVGPYLPLDAHFAVGNFISDAMKGGPIVIQGDGTPYRSYLYAADLTTWLWKILFCGQPLRPYNVGSSDAISLVDLAHLIADRFSPKRDVIVKQTPMRNNLAAARYVPDVTRAQTELGLVQTTNLVEAIDKTVAWFTARGNYIFSPHKNRGDL